jgi:hypothetical protein
MGRQSRTKTFEKAALEGLRLPFGRLSLPGGLKLVGRRLFFSRRGGKGCVTFG